MIYLASDHRGMVRKEEVKKILDEMGEKHTDVGNLAFDPNDDAIDFVKEACERMRPPFAEGFGGVKGIFFCGSGVMVDIVANRFPYIRSCLAVNVDQVKAARKEDDVNVLCLGADSFGLVDAEKLVRAFLETTFSNEEKYKQRIEKTKWK